jgi:hypothetical protein
MNKCTHRYACNMFICIYACCMFICIYACMHVFTKLQIYVDDLQITYVQDCTGACICVSRKHMLLCMYVCIRIYMHRLLFPSTKTKIHTYKIEYIHTYIQAYTRRTFHSPFALASVYDDFNAIHTYIHTKMNTYIHTYIQAYTLRTFHSPFSSASVYDEFNTIHTYIHTYTNEYIHTYTAYTLRTFHSPFSLASVYDEFKAMIKSRPQYLPHDSLRSSIASLYRENKFPPLWMKTV